MIKPVKSADLSLYVYSTIILPLKNLMVEMTQVNSPLMDKEDGLVWWLEMANEADNTSYDHRYERNRSLRNRNKVLMLKKQGGYGVPIGYYHTRRHWIKLYEFPLKELRSTHLMGKLHEVFDTNTPFTKVIIERRVDAYAELKRKVG